MITRPVVDEIRAFWEALPGAAYFAHTYQDGIAAVEVADVDARAAETAALKARARQRRAPADLRAEVETYTAAEWQAEEIQAARGAALRCALELAALPAG